MEVVVISRDTIKPSRPTPPHLRHFQLSFLDQFQQRVFSSFIYFYSSDSPAPVPGTGPTDSNLPRRERLRKSLSETLTLFYPLAGRLTDDDLSIDCNDAGVDYFEARANHPIRHFVERPDYDEINELLPYPDFGDANDMLMAVQVNSLPCGGMAIGICFGRKLLDAGSMFWVVNSWAAAGRGEKISNLVFPEFRLANLFPVRDIPIYGGKTIIPEGKNKVYAAKVFVFSPSAISALRSKYGPTHAHLNRPLSRVEVISAFIWSRYMVATQGDRACQVGKNYRVVQAVNLRPRADPPIPDSYFGNLSRFALTVPSMDGTADDGYGLVTQMRDAVKEIDSTYVKKLQEGDPNPVANTHKTSRGEGMGKGVAFTFTSVSKYTMYGADFGWGKPVWVTMAKQPVGNLIVLFPTRFGDGMEAVINMKKEELAKLEADKEFAALVSPPLVHAKPFLQSSL